MINKEFLAYKEFLTYKQALALKELGFDELCFGQFTSFSYLLLIGGNLTYKDINKELETLAPTYSQAFRWFREKYELKIFFAYWNGYNGDDFENEYKYECYIIPPNGPSITVRGEDNRVYFDIHEEAESACLDKLIEITKNK